MTIRNKVLSSEEPTLYIVATPIGNLQDISQRAVDILSKVDWIAAEDTRHTKSLLQAIGVQNNLLSLHEHNEEARSQQLLAKLLAGESGALVSDAGTPLINDPGYHVVKLLRENGVQVVPIPGPSAVITALSAAGLATDRFSYEGFLPAKSGKRVSALQLLKDETHTMVFYESPHRLVASLADFKTVMGEGRKLVVARELTKKFEQFVSGSITEVIAYFDENSDKVRGEFVLMLEGAEAQAAGELSEYDALINVLIAQNLPVKQISEIVAGYAGFKKKEVYQYLLSLKED